MHLRAMLAAALLAAAPAAAQEAAPEPEPRLVWLGTGAVTGVYFPVGVALCRLVNQHRREHGLRCAARLSEGSLANVEDLRAGALDLAVVQSDVQLDALTGAGAFAAAGPMPELRAVMALHPEPLTVVARADAGIDALADLAGRRVSLGAPGTGTRAVAEALMAELGWTAESFAATVDLDPLRQGRALCEGRVDAFLYAVGHPALAVQEATNECPATLVDATGPAVDALIAADPSFFAAEIPAGLYRGTDRPVQTFGVGATLVTRADVPEEIVHTLVAAVFDDFGTLRALHPALVALDPPAMVAQGLSAPLHPGAERYYRQRGWLR